MTAPVLDPGCATSREAVSYWASVRDSTPRSAPIRRARLCRTIARRSGRSPILRTCRRCRLQRIQGAGRAGRRETRLLPEPCSSALLRTRSGRADAHRIRGVHTDRCALSDRTEILCEPADQRCFARWERSSPLPGDVIICIVNGHPRGPLEDLLPWAYPAAPNL